MTPLTDSGVALRQALAAARETRCLEIGAGALARTPGIFKEHFGASTAVVVADDNTFAVAGRAVVEAFRSAGCPMEPPFVFRSSGLHAEHEFVAALEASLKQHQAIPVAVGSGTINDLTKLASYRAGRRYLCVASAASMDGYTAFGASVTFQGAKQTFFCPAPLAVVADLDIITAAPGLMNAWGYADLLAKVTAGADWLVADALGVEPIDRSAWEIAQGRLATLVAKPVGVRERDPATIALLVEGLMLSGFAMQATASSRPASGAEHQFSHLWDMQHHTHQGVTPAHGFKVALGTQAITALYERLLAQPLAQLDVEACCAVWPQVDQWVERARGWLGEGELGNTAATELRAKHSDVPQLRAQLQRLRACWPELSERLRQQLLPLSALRQKLLAVGAPTEPEQIGISRERLRQSYWQGFCIRRRFTVLDLAVRTGLLEPSLGAIFGPNGLWPAGKRLNTTDSARR